MFKLIAKCITKYKENRAERNALCKRSFDQIDYTLAQEKALFLGRTGEVDPEAIEKWRALVTETIATLSEVQLDIYWNVKLYFALKRRLSYLNDYSRLLDQRVAAHNQRVRDNRTCDQLISQAEAAHTRYGSMFQDVTEFVDPEQGGIWAKDVNALLIQRNEIPIKRWQQTSHYDYLDSLLSTLEKWQSSVQLQVRQHNEAVAKNRAEAAYSLIGDVEGRRLDEQQLNCIVKKVHNHLVIAGAGTGKTTTVIGKIKYLILSGQCRPEDILALSFTDASAAEMRDRIRVETGVPIQASTFHKLGVNIITKVNGIKPTVTKIDLRQFVREQLELNMRSDAYLGRLARYLLYGKADAKSEFEFKTKEEYDEYLRTNPPTTVNQEVVKSYGEMDIANFLNHNGIAYLYESPYERDTRTEEYAQYHPDFYLPEHKIYIEYFGINRNGAVPAYFSSQNGRSASQAYLDSMAWKRNLHKENKTTMIECFAYEKLEGTLEKNLALQLEANGVVLRPKSAKEIWSQVAKDGEKVLDGVVDLFGTVINLMKSNDYSIEEVHQKNVENGNLRSITDILWLVAPIKDAYEQYLRSKNEIDFNDMITLATEYVAQGKFQNPYRFVIVDEYQDISKARYRLLKSMRESHDFDLFCVGDDWQSIYRFAGSDIGYILNFAKYWGPSEESKIETTYRFEQSLIDISGNFIMMNPAQTRKEIQGKATESGFALSEISAYTEKKALTFMAERLDNLPQNSTVFFIGRYRFDCEMLKDSGLFELQYNNQSGLIDVLYRKRRDLQIQFMSAHKSKGLQADYVVILNNKNTRMGFPSRIQDSAVLDLLLEKADDYPYAEERRLFYVALTRAKKKVMLLTAKDRESDFIRELKSRYPFEIERASWSHGTCPRCGGRLIEKNGQYGKFLACSNFPRTGCSYTRTIR